MLLATSGQLAPFGNGTLRGGVRLTTVGYALSGSLSFRFLQRPIDGAESEVAFRYPRRPELTVVIGCPISFGAPDHLSRVSQSSGAVALLGENIGDRLDVDQRLRPGGRVVRIGGQYPLGHFERAPELRQGFVRL